MNCDEPLGVKGKTCVKFLRIFITYDVQILVEKNSKGQAQGNLFLWGCWLPNFKGIINLEGLNYYCFLTKKKNWKSQVNGLR